MYKKLHYIILIILLSCGDKDNSAAFNGKWKAKWEAEPSAFQGMGPDTKFTMDGEFIFSNENLTVTAMGYRDCLFGEDTISHTQQWKISSDTLYLISEPGITGITYLVKNQSRDSIELELMSDIRVTLTR